MNIRALEAKKERLFVHVLDGKDCCFTYESLGVSGAIYYCNGHEKTKPVKLRQILREQKLSKEYRAGTKYEKLMYKYRVATEKEIEKYYNEHKSIRSKHTS